MCQNNLYLNHQPQRLNIRLYECIKSIIMRRLILFSMLLFLASCNKTPQDLDGPFTGLVLIEKNTTTIGILVNANDTVYSKSESEKVIEELIIKNNKFEMGKLKGTVNNDANSIRFISKAHNCPEEADCFFPLIYENMAYSFDGENLSINTQRNYKEEFTNIGLEGYTKYDYALHRID